MKNIQIQMLHLIMLGGLAAGLTACVTSKGPQKSAQRKRSITFAKAIKDPDAYKVANVVWGGRIADVISDPNKGPELVVSDIPLYALGKEPVYGAKSQGFFIARSCGSLDPKIFRPGEVITLTGQIIGKATQPGNEGQQDCPEVQMESVRFWELKARPELYEGNTFGGDYFFDLTKPDGGWMRY